MLFDGVAPVAGFAATGNLNRNTVGGVVGAFFAVFVFRKCAILPVVVNCGFETHRGEDGDEVIGWAFTSDDIIGFFPEIVPGSFFKG